MEFVKRQGDSLIVENLFNEEHAAELIAAIPGNFSEIHFINVGVKVMRLVRRKVCRSWLITRKLGWGRLSSTTIGILSWPLLNWSAMIKISGKPFNSSAIGTRNGATYLPHAMRWLVSKSTSNARGWTTNWLNSVWRGFWDYPTSNS